MKMSDYINQIKTLYNSQRHSVELYGYCVDVNGQEFYYNTVEDYDAYVKDLLLTSIGNNSLTEDITVFKAFEILNN